METEGALFGGGLAGNERAEGGALDLLAPEQGQLPQVRTVTQHRVDRLVRDLLRALELQHLEVVVVVATRSGAIQQHPRQKG